MPTHPASRRRAATRPRPPRTPLTVVVRIALWRARALVPVGVLALAVVLAGHLAAPPPPPTEPVVVLDDDVRAGHALRPGDVRTVRMPRALVPDGALRSTSEAHGLEVVVDLPRGAVVLPGTTGSGRFGLEQPPGTVVVPLHLLGVGDLVRAGDRVDVLGRDGDHSGTEGGTVLARAALVLAVDDGGGGSSSLLGGGREDDAVRAVVAVSPAEGRALAGRPEGTALGAVLVR